VSPFGTSGNSSSIVGKKYSDWFAPQYVSIIEYAMKKYAEKKRVVKYLNESYPVLFKHFNQSWMSRYTKESGLVLKWKSQALSKIRAGRSYLVPTQVGCKYILHNYPTVKKKIVDSLKSLREAGMKTLCLPLSIQQITKLLYVLSGVPFNSATIRPLILGILRVNCPDVFHVHVGRKRVPFTVSRQCVHFFFERMST
jgi:hypothetical protein